MPRVKFETDQGTKVINFATTPTQQAIEEVVRQQGWKPKVTKPAPTPGPKESLPSRIDKSIEAPAYSLKDQGFSVGGLFKSAANIAKDLAAQAYGAVKMPFQMAKNVAYDIPKTLFTPAVGDSVPITPGTKTSPKIGPQAYPAAVKSGGFSEFIPSLPEAATKTITPPFVQKLTGVESGYGGAPQPTQALESLAEKPFSNILPYAMLAVKPAATGGLEFRGGTPFSRAATAAVEKVGSLPGKGAAAATEALSRGRQALATRYEGSGLPAKPRITPEAADPIIQEGIDKGVKPSVEIAGRKATGTRTTGRAIEANDQMKRAVRWTAENRSRVNLKVDPKTGEDLPGTPPKTVGEAALATDDALKAVWDKSQAYIQEAGARNAQFDPAGSVARLNKIISDPASTDAMVSEARSLVSEVTRLAGADPATVQARLKIYNAELQGFYKGTTNAVRKQVLADLSAAMREGMDKSIEEALGASGNQELRNQYRDLKTYQGEITHRAIVQARRAPKGLIDFSDIPAAMEMVKALATMDPVSLAKAAAIKGTAAFIKAMNNPDRYIERMYRAAYEAYPEAPVGGPVRGVGIPPEEPPQGGPGGNLPPPPESIQGGGTRQLFPSAKETPQIQPAAGERSLNWRSQAGGINLPADFTGFTDLSTKILDKITGRSVVSKQFVSDLTKSADVRGAEREVIQRVLSEYPEGTKIPAKEFADKVKTELLPLETHAGSPGSNPRYEGITLPNELRGNVANYEEKIYESPIKTSAGNVHFREQGGYGTSNYFAHTRVEDLGITSSKSGLPLVGKDFAKLERQGFHPQSIRRVIEVQSDLFQKGGLEKEVKNKLSKWRKFATPEEEAQLKEALGYKGKHNTSSQAKSDLDIINNIETAIKDRITKDNELKSLEPYRNTWHERIIREEVKQAALDGKTKLQFPTGETAMQIEGLGESARFYNEEIHDTLYPEDLKVGLKLTSANENFGDEWVVTQVLGDGKFKALPKTTIDNADLKLSDFGMEKMGLTHNLYQKLPLEQKVKALEKIGLGSLDRWAEQFDISGNVDTSNPIYKFYEGDVAKFLKSQFGAKQVTDPQGVKWMEVDIKPQMKNEPVRAFGFNNLFPAQKQTANA